MFDFSDKVVLITGALGNLGMAVAQRFQASGAQLALLDIQEDKLPKMYPDLVDSPAYQMLGDVDSTDMDSVKNAVSKIVNHFGRMDVLVNTVGGYAAGDPLHETSVGIWEKMINLNAKSVFITCQSTIPYMLDAGTGKIINIAARPGLGGKANMSAYSASKSAVLRLTESMAQELRGHGINLNCIIPGTMDTPENRKAMTKADYSKWVQPESVADVILFLASEMARDIHGAAVPVYGLS